MSAPHVDEKSHFLSQTESRREALRQKIDAAAERIARRTGIAQAVGTGDSAIVDRMEQLGFTGDSARVLDLLPLVHVAWADGKVQRAERSAVLAIVEQRGIQPDSDACLLIETLLEQRPSETFLAESLSLVRDLTAKSGGDASDVVELCAKVAEASGGLLGLGSKVSAAERTLIGQVASVLGDAAVERFQSRFRK
jgi:hypothetical protein